VPRSAASLAAALLLAGCAIDDYSPYPLAVEALPRDAFLRCRELLLREYGSLVESDADSFRLQTNWTPIADPPGERRASVFREPDRPGELAVVVELRWLRVPMLGVPHWTAPRGDDAAERELAERLLDALSAGRQPAGPSAAPAAAARPAGRGGARGAAAAAPPAAGRAPRAAARGRA